MTHIELGLLILLSIASVCAYGPASFVAEWTKLNEGKDPAHHYGVQGGYEKNGSLKTYVCRASLSSNLSVCGKYSNQFEGCMLGYSRTVFTAHPFEILTIPPYVAFKYMWTSKKEVLRTSGVHCGGPYYAGQADRDDSVFPGIIDREHNRITITDGDNVIIKSSYRSLIPVNRPIKGYRMTNVTYDLLHVHVKNTSMPTVATRSSIANNFNYSVDSTVSLSYETQKSLSWSHVNTYSLAVGANVSLKIHAGEIIKIGVNFTVSFKYTHTQETTKTETETSKVQQKVTVHLPPHTSVEVLIWVAQQQYLVSYNATMVVQYEDGTEGPPHKVTGEYNDVHSFEVRTEIRPPTEMFGRYDNV